MGTCGPQADTHVTRAPVEEREDRAETVFEEIMAEDLP